MKTFLLNNWFQLMLGSSLLMGSAGFLVYSTTNANAQVEVASEQPTLPVNEDGTITVRISQDQLDELKESLKSEGGSSKGVQDVRLVGWKSYYGDSYQSTHDLSGGYGGIPVYIKD